MRAVPHGFEGTHRLGRSSDTLVVLFGLSECVVDVVAVHIIFICLIGVLYECGWGIELKNLGGEKNTHSVLDSMVPRPMCISRPSRAK